MANKNGKTQADIEWENRRLCRDESCIGVIGPDGRCKECGLPLSPQKEKDDLSEKTETPADVRTGTADSPVEATDTTESDTSESEPFDTVSDLDWENRTLCIDESCIGIIGPDGRCKECGKPFN